MYPGGVGFRLRSWVWLAAGVVGGGALLAGAALWVGSGAMLRPEGYTHPGRIGTDPERAAGLAFEEVAFATGGGATLRGWWVPGAPGASAAVVAVHGAGGNRAGLLPETPFLRRAGYPALLFDLRGHGRSDGAARGLGFGPRESEDVSAAVAFVREQRGIPRVAALGTSLGGAAVLLAAARDPDIAAVIAENPWARILHVMRIAPARPWFVPELLLRGIRATAFWRLGILGTPEPLDAVGRIAPRPLLLLHGEADRLVPVSDSRALLAAAGEPAELWTLPGAGHGALYETDPEGYRERVLGFLDRWLPVEAGRSPAGGAAGPEKREAPGTSGDSGGLG